MQVLRIVLSASLAAFPVAALPVAALSEQGYFPSNGAAIHYTDEGAGPAVVYLHAFAGTSALWSAAGLAPLEGFRTITYDARGHGESTLPDGAGAGGDLLVADLLGLLEDRGLEAAHLVGYSMGAETALSFAAAYPERVLSLTVAGSGWSGAPEAQTYAFLSEALDGVARFADFMAAMVPEGTVEPAPEAAQEEQAAMIAQLAAHGIDPMQPAAPLAAVAAGLAAIIDLDAATLARFDFPVLGLAGEVDDEYANVERLAGVIPGYRFVPIPGADHLSAPLSPVFAATVAEFLAE